MVNDGRWTPSEWRSRAQAVVREIDTKDRVGACGRYVNYRRRPAQEGQETLPGGVGWWQTDEGHVRAGGLWWCGSAWACCDCYTGVAMHLSTLAAEAVVNVQADGGCAVLAVLTLPHRAGDELRQLWRQWLRGAWSWMTHRADWRAWCSRWGVDAWCSGTEVTHNERSGFHPHDNVVLLVPGRAALDPAELDQMERQLHRMWADALRAVGCDRHLSAEHGVVLRPVDDAETLGQYVWKHVGAEFASPSGMKEGKVDGSVEARDLLLLLADECKGEKVRDVARRNPRIRARVDAWLTYRDVSKGAQLFRASDTFYRWVGCKPMTVGQMRAAAGRLQREDRARLARALGQEAVEGTSTSRGKGSDADDEEDDPPVLWADDETFGECQAAYEDPKRRSGVLVLELIQARARRISFHAAISALIRRHGAELAGQMVAAMMARAPTVWVDQRGTVVVAYRQHGDWWPAAA